LCLLWLKHFTSKQNVMQKRKLGYTDEYVAAIGLGCMGMSKVYGPSDDAESIKTIHRALDLGGTFLDTADVYGLGHNEELVGKAIKGRRNEVFLATKMDNKDFAKTGVLLVLNFSCRAMSLPLSF